MFCPDCGLEDKKTNQYCRSCGTDLRLVRVALEKPDQITASAISARDEIGHDVVAKIRETRSAQELSKVAKEVLPKIEKFLESPDEKRLRRMRIGTTISSIGVGPVLIFFWMFFFNGRGEGALILLTLGVVTFFIGLGFILNGIFLTAPKKSLVDRSSDADKQRVLDADVSPAELQMPAAKTLFPSITENTTNHLKEKETISGDGH